MDSAVLKTATLVAKEDISQLKFPKENVLTDKDSQKELKAKIDKGLKLGNALKGKVKILFEDAEGMKTVETTIWGVTDTNILLKKTTTIPIRRIYDVKFY